MKRALHAVALALGILSQSVAAEDTTESRKGVPAQQSRGREVADDSKTVLDTMEDVRKRIAANPDVAVDMSHLKTLDPELAEVLICEDDVVRPVRRTRLVYYYNPDPDEELRKKALKPQFAKARREAQQRAKVVEYTVKAPGRGLYLNGLETISDDTLEVLGRHKGDLQLNGLKVVDPLHLTNHVGLLSLDGVVEIGFSGQMYSDLRHHHGPVSLRGLKRISAEEYYVLVTPWQYLNEYAEDFRLRLPMDLSVEYKQPANAGVVSWSQMRVEDTLANYVQQISEQADVEVQVDKAALKRLNLSESLKVSVLPPGRLVKTADLMRETWRLLPGDMNVYQAVALLALRMNADCPATTEDMVVAFYSGNTVFLTVAPKETPLGLRPGQGNSGQRVTLSTGEVIEGYYCGVPLEMQTLQSDTDWTEGSRLPDSFPTPGGYMFGVPPPQVAPMGAGGAF